MGEKLVEVQVNGEHLGKLIEDVQVIESKAEFITGVMTVELEAACSLPEECNLILLKKREGGWVYDTVTLPVTVESYMAVGRKLTIRYKYLAPARLGSYTTF